MARNKPVVPDGDIRDLRKDHKALLKQDPGADRAPELAVFARRAHVMRQLNMTMHIGQLALDEDPDAPTLLVDAYLGDRDLDDLEQGLHDLLDLADLGRWLQRDDITDRATAQFDEAAEAFIRDASDGELRHRMRLLTSMRDRAYADRVADTVRDR